MRFHAGTAAWKTGAEGVKGGNHDWVEVYDRGRWSFTGSQTNAKLNRLCCRLEFKVSCRRHHVIEMGAPLLAQSLLSEAEEVGQDPTLRRKILAPNVHHIYHKLCALQRSKCSYSPFNLFARMLLSNSKAKINVG